MLRIAAGITGAATLALLAYIVVGELRSLAAMRHRHRRSLIAEAQAEESASDLAMWEHQLSTPEVADLGKEPNAQP